MKLPSFEDDFVSSITIRGIGFDPNAKDFSITAYELFDNKNDI